MPIQGHLNLRTGAYRDQESFLLAPISTRDVTLDFLQGELPPKRLEDHIIDLISGSSPPNQPPYRVSASQQAEFFQQEPPWIGAGILAIPAVTQEAGFLASSFTCLASWLYMVTTGLLIAEVNVNTMCELGSGGVSLVSMAMRTLGRKGVIGACISYLFIHYALLVAYIARSSEILTSAFGVSQLNFAICKLLCSFC
ncbi:hypothetical protein L7F22_026887 [Adiantum nelumboides]|nr:hypothetical protein [Adiantum nelumboides]